MRKADDPLARLRARPEREVVGAVMAYLRTRPDVTAWRQNVGAVTTRGRTVRFGFPGLSDIVGWVKERVSAEVNSRAGIVYDSARARALFIECKRVGGRLSPAQAAFLDHAKKDGALVIVATSVEDVARELGPAGR